MNTEDSHPDAGMDLMFSRRADPRIVPADRYRISHPRIPRSERAGTQMVGVLVLILALCIGVPAVAHIVGHLRVFLHSIG